MTLLTIHSSKNLTAYLRGAVSKRQMQLWHRIAYGSLFQLKGKVFIIDKLVNLLNIGGNLVKWIIF